MSSARVLIVLAGALVAALLLCTGQSAAVGPYPETLASTLARHQAPNADTTAPARTATAPVRPPGPPLDPAAQTPATVPQDATAGAAWL